MDEGVAEEGQREGPPLLTHYYILHITIRDERRGKGQADTSRHHKRDRLVGLDQETSQSKIGRTIAGSGKCGKTSWGRIKASNDRVCSQGVPGCHRMYICLISLQCIERLLGAYAITTRSDGDFEHTSS